MPRKSYNVCMGRPSKYDSKFCDIAIKMMSKGHSKLSVAGRLGISRDTFYEWCRRYPEFSDTIKIGEMKSLHYWEEIGIKATMGKIKRFRPSIWIFTMKARFGWRDNSPVKNTEDMADRIEREIKEEIPTKTIAEIVKKYSDYIPSIPSVS